MQSLPDDMINEIILNLNMNDFIDYCRAGMCQDKHWIMKFKQFQIPLTTIPNNLYDWNKLYKHHMINKKINNILNQLRPDYSVKIMTKNLYVRDIQLVIGDFEQYANSDNSYSKKNEIVEIGVYHDVSYRGTYFVVVFEFDPFDRRSFFHQYRFSFNTKEQLYDFLFIIYSYNYNKLFN